MTLTHTICLIGLSIIVNYLLAAMTLDFFKSVIKWWRPWAGVLVLIPGVATVTGLLIMIVSAIILTGHVIWEFLQDKFSGFFERYPPNEVEEK